VGDKDDQSYNDHVLDDHPINFPPLVGLPNASAYPSLPQIRHSIAVRYPAKPGDSAQTISFFPLTAKFGARCRFSPKHTWNLLGFLIIQRLLFTLFLINERKHGREYKQYKRTFLNKSTTCEWVSLKASPTRTSSSKVWLLKY